MRTQKSRKKRHRFLYGIFMAALLGYLGLSVFFMERFFPGTRINDQDCGWMTVEEAETKLLSQAKMAPLTLLERGGETEIVAMEELGGHFEVYHQVDRIKRSQNGFLWPRMLMRQDCYAVTLEAVFDEAAFGEGVDQLNCMQEQKAPENAQIRFTDTGYEVQKEIEGNTLDMEIFSEAIRRAFSNLETELDLEETGCYEEPLIRADSPGFQKITEQLDLWLSAQITYEIGEEPQVIEVSQLQEWITLSEEGAKLQTEAIEAYVDALADAYDGETTKRVFYSTLQGRKVLTDKKHKWNIDREKEKEALFTCIQEGGRIQREPYYQVPSGSYMGSEIGDTYVEVDMTAQHLWIYRDGQLVLETDVVTGNTGRGTGTPGILAYIYAKQRNRTLRGDGYASFVKYWVPFYRGYGLHDANWRGSFGGEIYKTNGSHGCVNIPPAVMPEVYENVELGMPVITYY